MNPLLKTPSSDFASVRDGRNSLPLYIDIDLSVARNIAANTQLVIDIAANSLYSDQNILQGIATVHFQDTNLGSSSAPVTVNPGFIAHIPFTRLLIENTAQPGQRLRIFYGVDIDFQPGTGGQVTVSGTVAVINGELAKVKAGYAMLGGITVAGVAGQYSYAQLWNPAGSGKNLILNKVSMSGPAGTFGAGRHNVALTIAGPSVQSKLIGGSVGVGVMRYQNTPVAIGTDMFFNQIGVSGDAKEFSFSEPLVIPPGNGLHLFAGALASNLYANFQWNEENI